VVGVDGSAYGDPAVRYGVEVAKRAGGYLRLVVVGRHGTGGLQDLPLGSVTRALTHHTHCPLLVVSDQDA
jgi:nucleotide-binding universal stress UspA family protein